MKKERAKTKRTSAAVKPSARVVSAVAVKEEVLTVVSNLAKIPREKIEQCNKESFIDLGLDSFVLVEIVFSIENTFDIDIPHDSLPGIKNLDDLISLIVKLIEQKRG